MFSGRSQGVTTPSGQGNPRNAGPENTVTNAVEVSFVAVEYFDEEGRAHTDVLLKMGGSYYKPPSSEEWSRALRSVASWLSNGIARKLATPSVKVPVEDSVSVVDDVQVTAKATVPDEVSI